MARLAPIPTTAGATKAAAGPSTGVTAGMTATGGGGKKPMNVPGSCSEPKSAICAACAAVRFGFCCPGSSDINALSCQSALPARPGQFGSSEIIHWLAGSQGMTKT